jgi:hypothetical protein
MMDTWIMPAFSTLPMQSGYDVSAHARVCGCVCVSVHHSRFLNVPWQGIWGCLIARVSSSCFPFLKYSFLLYLMELATSLLTMQDLVLFRKTFYE